MQKQQKFCVWRMRLSYMLPRCHMAVSQVHPGAVLKASFLFRTTLQASSGPQTKRVVLSRSITRLETGVTASPEGVSQRHPLVASARPLRGLPECSQECELSWKAQPLEFVTCVEISVATRIAPLRLLGTRTLLQTLEVESSGMELRGEAKVEKWTCTARQARGLRTERWIMRPQ
jgi:hypothetical protein